MRIVFVRHGEPDYENDCLTEKGRQQAMAVSKRLAREGISELYASPMGRAQETASYTASALGLDVVTLDFMHEISWGGNGIPEDGHPWTLSDMMIGEDNFDFYAHDWKKHPYFEKNVATEIYDGICRRFDDFLKPHGYLHEGSRFFCTADSDKTIAIFSHGGSGASVISHLLSLPFPYVLTVFPYDVTSVTILHFPVKKGSYVHPRMELFNDVAHIGAISDAYVFKR